MSVQNRLFKSVVIIIGSLLLIATQVAAAVSLPAFSLPEADGGKVVTNQAYEGKALLITFFATWCAPCLQEIPALKELHNKYQSQDFAVLGLSVDESGPQVVVKLIKKAEINYTVLMADRAITRKFGGIAGIPTSFLVNKQGEVVKKYPGYVPRSLLEKDIKAVL